MHGPLASFKVIPGSFAGRDIVACQPEDLAPRSLQVVPDHLAIAAEEFVSFNLHVNRAMVNLGQPGAIGANGPGTIHLVPWSFMTKHQERRIGWRKLDMIDPVCALQ